ncbi:MAG: tol-pal system protein YbgF [Methylococcales bacterium]|nr:tol-pal system protein YbgF [Methylococcales bacterium]MDD5754376.1 tol-pal system protein YbgF [Methylococcales bacterium]
MKKLPALLLFASSFALADSLAPVIDNSAYPTGGSAAARTPIAVSAPMNSTFELMTRLDEAQVEIQQLNGKLEEQANLIAEMKKKQSVMNADFDDRLQQVETKLSGSKPAASAETPALPAKEPEPVEATPPTKPVASVVPPAATPADEKKQQYLQAFEAFRNGQVAEAITQFNTLLSKDPSNLYANNAQFWLGKAYRVSKDTGSAKKAFNTVLEKYPTSQKVPDTLLELGMIEMDAKNSARAKELFTRVITDFPNSKPAQVAAKKLQQLNDVPN